MSRRQSTRGACVYCKKTYTGSGMSRHLKACKARQAALDAEETAGARKTKLLHLVVKGTYNPIFWLNLEMPASATLYDLDQFLRGIWLECCGHLSMFEIRGQRFQVMKYDDDWGFDDPDMDVALERVLAPGLEFSHEYDFGSTTYLTLRVVGERVGVAKKGEPVRVLARNELPDFRCQVCDEPAKYVNVFEDYVLLCDDCAKVDETGGEGLLPVVNSPRMGTCGYTGDAW